MSDKKVVTFEFRKGTTSEWDSKNPVLAAGEPGFDTETKTLKMGDGLTPWANLPSVGGNELQTHYRNQTVEGPPEFNGPALVYTLYPKPAMVGYGLWSPGYYGSPDDLLDYRGLLSVGSDPDNALSVDTTYEYYTLDEYWDGPQSIKVSPTTSSAYVTLDGSQLLSEDLNDVPGLGHVLSVGIKTPSVWSNGTIKILRLSGYDSGPNFLSVDLDVVSGKASFVLRDYNNVEVVRSTNSFGVDEKVRVEVLLYGDDTYNEEARIYRIAFLNIYRYGESTTTWSSQPIKMKFEVTAATTLDIGKINEGPSNISDLLISEVFFEVVPYKRVGPTLGWEYEETGHYVEYGNGQALGRIGYVSENSYEFTFDSEEDMWDYFPEEEGSSGNNSSLTECYRVAPTMATDTLDRLSLEITQRSVNNVTQWSWNGQAFEVQTKLEMSFESLTDPGSNIRELYVDLDEIESDGLHWWNRGPEGGVLPAMGPHSPFEGMHGDTGGHRVDSHYFAGHMPVTVVCRVEKYDPVNGYDDDVYFDVDRSFTAIVSWSISELGIPDGWIDNALILQIAHPMDAMVDINNRFGDQTKDRVTYHATIEYSDIDAPATLG